MVSGDFLTMAKSLVFGNGYMHVGLDEHGLVHDLYYPYVGLENHLPPHGLPHKIGVFVDGWLSWLDEPGWHITAQYHDGTMIGETVATNDALGVRLELTDTVDSEVNAFVRSIHVINLRADERTLTLYCYQAFMIGDSASSDSAQYRPDLPAVMHYKGNRVVMVSLISGGAEFDDFSIGRYDTSTHSGTFRDAEDGSLAQNMVENGSVDSTMGLTVSLDAYDSVRASYILVASETVNEGEHLLDEVMTNGVMHYLARTAAYWRAWTGKTKLSMRLDERYRKALNESLLVIAAHLDARGAVMASLDSSLRNHPQDDAYNFCWPRDAVYALWPLLRLGYTDELLAFFDFVARGIHEDGYVYHKYRADGSLGSTWLPYKHLDGSIHPPIQSDETAATLFLLGQYYRHTSDQAFITRYYETLVEPMANFLAGHTTDDGLPLPSYDLWEHQYLTHTYTTAITYASLLEASELADAYGRSADGARWRTAAEAMQSASSCFYNREEAYFYKGFSLGEDGERQFDTTLDSSSLYGAFMFGLFDLESEELDASVQTARKRLGHNGLYTRFIGDDYYGNPDTPNLWPVVSLWMAEIALERDELDEAESTLDAVLTLSNSSGLLPEQVSPDTHSSTSLTPLVWSHAELISALIDHTQTKRPAS